MKQVSSLDVYGVGRRSVVPHHRKEMITQAAWQAVRRSPRMKAVYERVKPGQKQRKAAALVATAHKMLRIMLAMLKSRQEWREGPDLPAAAPANRIETPRPRRRGRGKVSAAA